MFAAPAKLIEWVGARIGLFSLLSTRVGNSMSSFFFLVGGALHFLQAVSDPFVATDAN